MTEQAEVEYFMSRDRKQKVLMGCVMLSIFPGLTSLLFGIYRHLNPNPGDEKGVSLAIALMGGAIIAGCILALLALPRAGRLVFFAKRAELPRSLVPPWCFLAPIQLPFADVSRWGTGEVWRSDKTVTVLASR